ncbi:hypothetical protein LMG33810_001952 [Carnimonas sp. LMG 33810]
MRPLSQLASRHADIVSSVTPEESSLAFADFRKTVMDIGYPLINVQDSQEPDAGSLGKLLCANANGDNIFVSPSFWMLERPSVATWCRNKRHLFDVMVGQADTFHSSFDATWPDVAAWIKNFYRHRNRPEQKTGAILATNGRDGELLWFAVTSDESLRFAPYDQG